MVLFNSIRSCRNPLLRPGLMLNKVCFLGQSERRLYNVGGQWDWSSSAENRQAAEGCRQEMPMMFHRFAEVRDVRSGRWNAESVISARTTRILIDA